jgi:hypothetical protein
MSAELKPFLNEADTARLLRLSSRTLQRWRVKGGDPQFTRMGAKRVGYSPQAIAQWADGNSFPHRAAELTTRLARMSQALASDTLRAAS